MERKSHLLLLSLILTFVACTMPVVERNYRGERENPADIKEQFKAAVKKKIVILDLTNEAPVGGDDLSTTVTEELKKELLQGQNFIIDPMASKMFGNSKEIYAGGGLKLVQLSRNAKIAGINFVIFGRIQEARVREKSDEIGIVRETKSFSEVSIELRIFDVNSNKEIYTEVISGFADDKTFRFYGTDQEQRLSYKRDLLRYAGKIAARRAIPKINDVSSKLDWVGRIAKIIGNKIYINAGRSSGIQIGDVLKVITEGSEIFDPETGSLLGISKGEIKGAIEVIDYFGQDGAICILHSGGSVLEGDFVQLY